MNALELAVHQGLVTMLARSLENSPAADEVGMVADVMAADLRRSGYGDHHAVGVARALDEVGRTATRWPMVSQIVASMRTRAHFDSLNAAPALPAPEMSEERRREHLAHLEKIRKQLRDSTLPGYRRSYRDAIRREDTTALEAELDARAGDAA